MAEQQREPYDHVHALLLGWEHDENDHNGNKQMRAGIEELDQVLQGHFAYQTHSSWRIPAEDYLDPLYERLRGFREQHDKARTLLMVYYAGHGCVDENSRDLFWLL